MIGSLVLEKIPGANPEDVLWRMRHFGLFFAGRNGALPEDHENASMPEVGGLDAGFALRQIGPNVLGYLVDGDGFEVDDELLADFAAPFLLEAGPPLRLVGHHGLRSGRLLCATQMNLRDGTVVVTQTRKPVGQRRDLEVRRI